MSEKLNVKVGDKVLVTCSGYGLSGGYKYTDIVSKITPTGRIRLAKHRTVTFYPDGTERVSSDAWAPRGRLELLTPEKETELRKEVVIRKCLSKMHETTDITYEQAAAIMEILKAATPSEGDAE